MTRDSEVGYTAGLGGSVVGMFSLTVEDVFVIRGRGVVATGRIAEGTLHVGDEVQINGGFVAQVDGIEMFRKKVDEATAGRTVGIVFGTLEKSQLTRGSVLTSVGSGPPPEGVTVTL
jgi:translation elongation factor EF-Tu-like GTPase